MDIRKATEKRTAVTGGKEAGSGKGGQWGGGRQGGGSIQGKDRKKIQKWDKNPYLKAKKQLIMKYQCEIMFT